MPFMVRMQLRRVGSEGLSSLLGQNVFAFLIQRAATGGGDPIATMRGHRPTAGPLLLSAVSESPFVSSFELCGAWAPGSGVAAAGYF